MWPCPRRSACSISTVNGGRGRATCCWSVGRRDLPGAGQICCTGGQIRSQGAADMAVAAGPEQERSLGSGGDVAARWGGPHWEKVGRGGAGQGAPRGRSGDLQALAALASASRRMDTATVVALLHCDGGGCVTSGGEVQRTARRKPANLPLLLNRTAKSGGRSRWTSARVRERWREPGIRAVVVGGGHLRRHRQDLVLIGPPDVEEAEGLGGKMVEGGGERGLVWRRRGRIQAVAAPVVGRRR